MQSSSNDTQPNANKSGMAPVTGAQSSPSSTLYERKTRNQASH